MSVDRAVMGVSKVRSTLKTCDHITLFYNIRATTALPFYVIDREPPLRISVHSISDLAALSLPFSSRIAFVVLGAREAVLVSFKPSIITDN